jgi:membrane protease YdiL (CAAX protease family)
MRAARERQIQQPRVSDKQTMPSLLKFFCVAYIVSWACFIAAGTVAASSGALRALLFLLGTFAPALVALVLTARAEGRAEVLGLLRETVRWRVGARWYLFAVSYMAAIKLAVALIYRLVTGGWTRFGQDAWYVILAAILLSTPVQAGEEIGWRGYALPRLAGRVGLAKASILLGAVWACWHLPFFFIPGADKSGQSFPVYFLQVVALSVAAAWLYWRTERSLLLVMLMHSAINQTTGLVPSTVPNASNAFGISASLVAWLTVGLLSVAAAYFLVQMRSARLPEGGRRTNKGLESQQREPLAPPNGGPAQPSRNPGTVEGPPSVS